MTATATQPKRPSLAKAAKSKAKAGSDAIPDPPSPAAETVAGIEAELVKLRADLEKASKWGTGDWKAQEKKEAELEDAIAAAEARLALARVKKLPAAPVMAAALTFEERSIPIASIVRTGNHREGDDPAQVEQLRRSLVSMGLQQRIAVRMLPGEVGTEVKHELIWGSRRTTAAEAAGWTEIPAKVYPSSLTPTDVEILRTIENFGRKELTPVERVIAVARILDSIEKTLFPARRLLDAGAGDTLVNTDGSAMSVFEALRSGWRGDVAKGTPTEAGQSAAMALYESIDQAGGVHGYVSHQLGQTAKWVADHAFVARLGGEARKLLSVGRISLGHARELAKLGDKEAADAIALDVAKKEDGLGGASVAETAKKVVERLRSLKIVPWRLDMMIGSRADGCTGHACATCPCNTRTEPDLYGGALADEPDAGYCTNEGCFKQHQVLAEAGITKFVKLTAALKKKDKGLAITETALAGVAAGNGLEFVKLSTAVRKAKKELEPAAPAAKARSGGASQPTYNHRTPEQQAYDRYDQAREKWGKELAKKINAALAAKPGRLGLFTLLYGGKTMAGTSSDWCSNLDVEKKKLATAAVNTAKAIPFIQRLATPTLDGLIALEKTNDNLDLDDYEACRWPAELADAFCEVLDIDPLPRPRPDDFIPQTTPVEAKLPAKKPAKGKREAKAGSSGEADRAA